MRVWSLFNAAANRARVATRVPHGPLRIAPCPQRRFTCHMAASPLPIAPADADGDRPAITIRGAAFTVAVAHLASADLDEIDRGLAAKVAQAAELFRNAPVVIDLLQLARRAAGHLRRCSACCAGMA